MNVRRGSSPDIRWRRRSRRDAGLRSPCSRTSGRDDGSGRGRCIPRRTSPAALEADVAVADPRRELLQFETPSIVEADDAAELDRLDEEVAFRVIEEMAPDSADLEGLDRPGPRAGRPGRGGPALAETLGVPTPISGEVRGVTRRPSGSTFAATSSYRASSSRRRRSGSRPWPRRGSPGRALEVRPSILEETRDHRLDPVEMIRVVGIADRAGQGDLLAIGGNDSRPRGDGAEIPEKAVGLRDVRVAEQVDDEIPTTFGDRELPAPGPKVRGDRIGIEHHLHEDLGCPPRRTSRRVRGVPAARDGHRRNRHRPAQARMSVGVRSIHPSSISSQATLATSVRTSRGRSSSSWLQSFGIDSPEGSRGDLPTRRESVGCDHPPRERAVLSSPSMDSATQPPLDGGPASPRIGEHLPRVGHLRRPATDENRGKHHHDQQRRDQAPAAATTSSVVTRLRETRSSLESRFGLLAVSDRSAAFEPRDPIRPRDLDIHGHSTL